MASVSTLGRAYKKLYEALCGRHPYQKPWHFQWLAVYPLHRELRRIFRGLAGRILDVGCGDKPYRHWFSRNVSQYIGLDVVDGPKVDMVVEPMVHWEIADQAFDVVIATQVLEHVENLNHTLSEITRVLKPGGILVLSFPFLYNEHGAPYDFRRFTRHGAANLLLGFKVESVKLQGGIGSTIGILLLNWIEMASNRRKVTRLLKGLFLPLWIVASLLVNMLALIVDRLDGTDSFYNNIVVVLRKANEEENKSTGVWSNYV